MGAAMSGATHQFGWPDRAPCGPFGPWTDGVAPRFIVASILAALHRRTRTGEGCYIDVAQAEAGMQFMMPAYYEYAANGKIPERRGVAGSPLRVPEGVYRCAGEDRWIAISASTRRIGMRFAQSSVVGCATRASTRCSAGFAIAPSSRRRSPDGRATGVRCDRESPANRGRSGSYRQPGRDLERDADLLDAGQFKKFTDEVFGEAEIEGPRCALDRTRLPGTRRGPRIGEHTKEILETVLGMSEKEIAQLSEAGVLV